jgi:hypothetical protein
MFWLDTGIYHLNSGKYFRIKRETLLSIMGRL